MDIMMEAVRLSSLPDHDVKHHGYCCTHVHASEKSTTLHWCEYCSIL